jgi:hypothetical protein
MLTLHCTLSTYIRIFCQVMERHRCIDYSSVSDQKKTDVRNTGECSTNNCAKGCCRDYQFLVCDEDNDFPDLACICNVSSRIMVSFASIL